MELKSEAFSDGQAIPVKYTTDGEDLSPPLAWSSVPAEAKSLALVVEDPDAPSGTFRHWVLYNIEPGAREARGRGTTRSVVEGAATATSAWGRPLHRLRRSPSPAALRFAGEEPDCLRQDVSSRTSGPGH